MLNRTPGEISANTQGLFQNPYFGRLIIMGRSPDGESVLVLTAISGRSKGSQNRRYSFGDSGRIFTEVADPELEVGNPELTLYDTQMENCVGTYVASNGRQTADCFSEGGLGAALLEWSHEPDEPHFTPRISARCQFGMDLVPRFEFCIHRKMSDGKEGCSISANPRVKLDPGLGLYVCTYEGNGNPLPSFVGDARLIYTSDDLIDGLTTLAASKDFLVSVAVKRIRLFCGTLTSEVEIWNRHDQPAR